MTPPRPRHLIGGLVVAIVVGVAVVVAVGRIAGASELRSALDGARPGWLAACVAGQLAVFAGYAGVFRRATADEDGSLSTLEAVRIVLASFAATQLLAFGGAAGLALLYWVLRRRGRDRRSAAVTLIGLNTAVYAVFAGLAFGAAVVVLAARQESPTMAIPWVVGIPLVVGAAAWFTSSGRRDGWDRPGRLRSALGVGVAAAVWARHRMTTDRRLYGWALLYWVGDLVSLGAAVRAFGGGVDPASLTVAYTTGYLAQAVPVPLIATAGVDVATTATLHAMGVDLEVALLGVVAHRVFAFWLPVVPGIVMALGLPRAAWASDDTESTVT